MSIMLVPVYFAGRRVASSQQITCQITIRLRTLVTFRTMATVTGITKPSAQPLRNHR